MRGDYREHADPSWRAKVERNEMPAEEWDREVHARSDELKRLQAAGGERFKAEDEQRAKRLLGELQVLQGLPDPAHKHPGHARDGSGKPGSREGLGAAWLKGIDDATGGRLMAVLDGTSGGSAVPAFYDPQLKDLPQRALFVRSIIPAMGIDGDTVSFLQQTVATNNAAAVARGAIKPTSVYTVARLTAPVQTIAHVSEALDRLLLSDFDQLTQFLEQQLRLGVLLATDNELLNGTGVSPRLLGVLQTPGIQTQAKGADTAPDAIEKAITKIRLNSFSEPDAIVMHPTDWQNLSLLKATTNEYLFDDFPSDEPAPRLWGKTVITSPVIAVGTALVGSFATASKIYDREEARITFTEAGLTDVAGHDLFLENRIRFRGEERLAFATFYPSRYCTVTGL